MASKMLFDPTAINAALDNVVKANGGTFVSVAQSPDTRAALITLLEAFGVSDVDVHKSVTPNDLSTLYASARKKHSIGDGVAKGLEKKYGKNPLFDPPAPAPSAPVPAFDSPPPAAKPSPQTGAPYDDSKLWEAVGGIRTDLRDLDTVVNKLPDAIAEKVQPIIAARVEAAIKAQTPTRVEIVTADAPPMQLGLVHCQTPTLIKLLAAGVNVYLYGPAGTGKTTAGQQCADAFKLPFYFAAKVESEYMLLGFKDARGETVRTQFREAYEHGGVFLFDELDGSSAGAVVALNAALANGVCPFPDGVVKRHANFKCIGAGNTGLSGATRQYVGRNQLDAASVDRFAFLPFDYDDKLEQTLAANKQWCAYVQAVRKAVKDRALPHLVTPRATYDGCKLLANGVDVDTVADACVWKGLDRATVAQLQSAVGDVSDYFDMTLVA